MVVIQIKRNKSPNNRIKSDAKRRAAYANVKREGII
jgi:hypothetical protein